jgi:hypothetical protein
VRRGDWRAVDERAVAGAAIVEEVAIVRERDLGVLAGHFAVGERQIAGRSPANGERRLVNGDDAGAE